MSDTHARQELNAGADGDAIAGFASRVLDVLVDRSRRTTSTLRADLVLALSEGMVTQDDAQIERTLTAFRRACISPEAMADVYVPAAARHLGLCWENDSMAFAEVSIASSRLQALVRAIGTRWGGDAAHVPGRRSILMVVPRGEDHTLGAVVATGQLRQMGFSVCLRLGVGPGDLGGLLRTRVFDAAMISIGQSGSLDLSAALVDMLRRSGPARLPILAGGAMVTRGIDVVSLVGVDDVVADVGQAIALCGFGDRSAGKSRSAACGVARSG